MGTIFALATARGASGVAVIRVSGPDAVAACTQLCGPLPAPRMSAVRKLHGADGALVDEALVLRFEAGHSFTGDDVVELHTHGSPAVVAAVLRELSEMDGLRQAEAGEFTRRALENDRLDLAQIEGLGDLILAETEAQRRQAMRVFSGHLGDKAAAWRVQLVRAMALLEATIDFVDEDVPVDVTPEVNALLDAVAAELASEIAGSHWAERLTDGFQVAIVGAPNTGKSTLLNYLAGRDVAITSEIAGTTRDIVTARLDIDGIPVEFLDTAGLRETDDVVETIGVSRARHAAERADLRVALVEDLLEEPDVGLGPDDLILLARQDDGHEKGISGVTGLGVDAMLAHISQVFSGKLSGVGAAVKERHRVAMQAALSSIEVAKLRVATGEAVTDLAAEELRSAVMAVESLVGAVDVEHILDEIFSSFCIGK